MDGWMDNDDEDDMFKQYFSSGGTPVGLSSTNMDSSFLCLFQFAKNETKPTIQKELKGGTPTIYFPSL